MTGTDLRFALLAWAQADDRRMRQGRFHSSIPPFAKDERAQLRTPAPKYFTNGFDSHD